MGSALSAPTMATMYTKLLPCQIYCPPSPASYSHTRDIVMLSTIDGKRIACRLFAPFKDNVDTFVDYKNRHSTILFSHGNADDIGTSASYCQWIADSVSCNVVAYDYVNYGLSDRHETTEHNMHHSIDLEKRPFHHARPEPQAKPGHRHKRARKANPPGVRIGEVSVAILQYVDDAVLLARSQE